MDASFLKQAQRAGWHINKVEEKCLTVSCPSAGCGLKATLIEGGHVPGVDPQKQRNLLDQPISSFDDIRLKLRARREELALSIREVEEIGGIAVDYLAKFEKNPRDNEPRKIPNAQTMFEWAQSLGYEIVLRPTPLTAYALRTVCDTRDRVAARTKRFTIEDRRRTARAKR